METDPFDKEIAFVESECARFEAFGMAFVGAAGFAIMSAMLAIATGLIQLD